ncbi:PepSY domain-containing protein [Streptomyces sp. NPDC016309]|uniref:PepSY domain-containing protein n=1 Tax=Streptomyces sp. NPDC016309 TaxID=3364965 RepID=UPI0036FF34D9
MKRNVIIATVTAAALLTGGTAAAFAATSDDDAPVQRPAVTAEQALKAVAAHGTVVSLELDDDGRSWDVELVTKDGGTRDWTVDGKGEAKPDPTD